MKALIPQTITIPGAAGGNPGTLKVSAAGQYFYCQTASSNFSVQFDGGLPTAIQPGMQIPGSFSRLTFYNAAAATVNVTFYTSLTPIEGIAVSTALIQNSLAACVLQPENQVQVSAAAGGQVANAFMAAGNYFRQAILIAQKALNRTANVGAVYFGTSAAAQPIKMNPGDTWTLQADPGGKRDFGLLFIAADNAGDGISIIYV